MKVKLRFSSGILVENETKTTYKLLYSTLIAGNPINGNVGSHHPYSHCHWTRHNCFIAAQ